VRVEFCCTVTSVVALEKRSVVDDVIFSLRSVVIVTIDSQSNRRLAAEAADANIINGRCVARRNSIATSLLRTIIIIN